VASVAQVQTPPKATPVAQPVQKAISQEKPAPVQKNGKDAKLVAKK
jgi:hypothetical protein